MDGYAQIAHRVSPGAAVLRRWPLRGGVSAHVEALELALSGGTRRRVVVRRHGAAKWKTLDSQVTVTEFTLLNALAAAGMQVPQPLFLEATGDVLGSPFFVMEFVDGATDVDTAALPDALAHMADYLRRLHSLQLDLPALRKAEEPASSALAFVPDSDPVHAALQRAAVRPSKNAPVLLHGDYWPGNVLWKDGKIAAVIDWEDVALGDPVSDLACCRLELTWKYERGAADTFTQHYLSRATIDCTDLPIWEFYAASAAAACMSEWGLPPEREADMRSKAASVIAATRTIILERG